MARLPRYPAEAKVSGSDLNLILSILDSGGIANSGSTTASGVTGDSLSSTTPNLAGSINPTPGGAGNPTTVRGLTGSYGIDNFSQSHTAYVFLSWTPNPVSDFISRYDIYYHKGSDPTLYNLSVGGDVSSARINNLFPGNTYSFSAQAHDAANRASQWCPEITVTISLDSDPPAIPTGLTATSTSTGVYLTWTEVGPDGNSEDLKQYQIAVSLDGGATYPTIRSTGPGNSYFYTPTTANQGTVFFKVATVDWTGNVSDYSAPASAAVGTTLGAITINPGPLTVVMNAGTVAVLNRSDVAASLMTHVAAQRAGANKWWLGLDASDQFVLLNAAGNTSNVGVTDLGVMTVRGGLTVSAGGASVTGNSTVTGTLNVTSTLTAPASNGIVMGSGSTALTLNDQQASAQTLNFPAIRESETIAIKPQFMAATTGGFTGTSNTTGLMMGWNQTITPQVTGRLLIIVETQSSTNTNGAGGTVGLRYGTGTPPVNGAALTGTAIGANHLFTEETATFTRGQSIFAVVTGLTVNTAYWIDVSLAAVTAGTASINGGTLVAIEI